MSSYEEDTVGLANKHQSPIYLHPHRLLLHYFSSHWQGQQGLACSFWVNLILLRIVIFTIQSIVSPHIPLDHVAIRWAIGMAVFVFHGLVLVWQIVGVVRAAEADFSTRGNMALVWGAQLGGVLFFILSISYAIEALQLTMVSSQEENPFSRIEREHANQYSLTVDPSGHQLTIDGLVALGITKAVKQVFNSYPAIKQVTLNSSGGNIYEARGLAKLFTNRKLNTHIHHTCASACTTAYAGGLTRSAAPTAAIGFHQYRVDADYSILVTDVQSEQNRDAALFIKAGISTEFVKTMFDRVSEDMWWPTLEELLQAGFVHEQHINNAQGLDKRQKQSGKN